MNKFKAQSGKKLNLLRNRNGDKYTRGREKSPISNKFGKKIQHRHLIVATDIYRHTIRFQHMLETQSIKEGICSEGTKSSTGTCTLNFTNNFEITEYATDKDGRLVITNVGSKYKEEKFTLVNTYVPTEKRFQKRFLDIVGQKNYTLSK